MPRLSFTATACGLLLTLGLGGCAYDDGYGYGGVDIGYGSAYGPGYYGPAGYGYGGYGGWYDDYYYPGSGYYVYDRGGSRHRWNDRQRGYWEARRREALARGDRDRRPGDGIPGNGQPGNSWRDRRDDGNRYERDRNRDDRRQGWNGAPGNGAVRSRQDWEANRQRQWREQGQRAVRQPPAQPAPAARPEARPEARPAPTRGDWSGIRKAIGAPERARERRR
ncbi:peptidase [Sphingobium sp. H39-3-25]|uniref:peptidase n=1 Tax=Sphingobium arseniciresistens TaxID=3030834 RepID=UPI0023B8BE3E|nr:peptidase [Sphingobium arseniciresistens]